MPGTGLRALYVLTCLILTTPWGKLPLLSLFYTQRNQGTEQSTDLPRVTTVSSRIRVPPSVSWTSFRTQSRHHFLLEALSFLDWVKSLLCAPMAHVLNNVPLPPPRRSYPSVKFACLSSAGLETIEHGECLPSSLPSPPSLTQCLAHSRDSIDIC